MTGEWISIEDEKPHQYQDVYVCRNAFPRCAFPAHYIDGQFHVFDMIYRVCVFKDPTHWMPMELPEPPE